MRSYSLDALGLLALEVPAELTPLADGWNPATAPVRARLAATVVLCRDGCDGLETYLLHRHARMRFAASAAVFPGGGLEDVDRPAGRSIADALRACAVRETGEETGVLLDPADLVPWAHWITPAMHPIRYDTYFYLAGLPARQRADDLSTETERAAWTQPADAVSAYESGSIDLLPPTLSILQELSGVPSTVDALRLGSDRVIETVLPGVERAAGGWVYRYPGPPTPENR